MAARASIDLGTNTCLLLLSDWDAERRVVSKVISDHSTIVRLGEGVDRTRVLSPAAMDRTLACLQGYSEKIRAAGIEPRDAICVATSQARDASNGREFFARIEKELGLRFRVLSGDEEARYTFLGGLLPGMNPARSAVIDIGGGSTELISLAGGESLDMGSVRFTERYLNSDPVTDDEFWRCQDEIDAAIDAALGSSSGIHGLSREARRLEWVAVAGTATTLAAWYLELDRFDAAKIDTVSLTRGDVHRMVEELKWRTVEERRKLPGIEAARADVLLAGALILWRCLERFGIPEIRVSTRGLRFGVLGI